MSVKITEMVAGSVRVVPSNVVGATIYHLYNLKTDADNHVMNVSVVNDAIIDGWQASSLGGQVLGNGKGYVELSRLLAKYGCLATFIDAGDV